MTHAVIQQPVDRTEPRERQLAEQIGELAARLRESQAEREALATTAKTVRAMAADLDLERPPASALPPLIPLSARLGSGPGQRISDPLPGYLTAAPSVRVLSVAGRRIPQPRFRRAASRSTTAATKAIATKTAAP